MSRWMIEKSGTGIEKSGTGIEKSGTGIEKSGTGIEKSGTGIQKYLFALSLACVTFAAQISAAEIAPGGLMQVVADQGRISVMWVIDGNTFVGKASQTGTHTQLSLFEVSVGYSPSVVDIAGGGTGTEIAGGGTGSQTKIAGGGTGIEIAGGGTGIEIAGGGTGTEIAGGGTGAKIQIAGGGTGSEAVFITLPKGIGLGVEVSLGCQKASVSVLDTNSVEVVTFNNVQIMGDTGLCDSGDNGFGPQFGTNKDR